jgi:hypothetical protein
MPASPPSPDDAALLERALDRIDPAQRARCVLYRLKSAPALRFGPTSLAIGEGAAVVFADLMPGANWTHPAMCLVVEPGGVRAVPVQYPPAGGAVEKVLFESPGIEPWQRLPVSAR